MTTLSLLFRVTRSIETLFAEVWTVDPKVMGSNLSRRYTNGFLAKKTLFNEHWFIIFVLG